MSARLTLADVTGPVAQTLNLNQSGPKVVYYINAAQEELLNMGRWVGTTIKYRICANQGFITWPREIETIEAMRVNGVPATLNNQWYQFLDYGGWCDGGNWGSVSGGWGNGYAPYSRGNGIDEREAISFADVCGLGNPKKLKVYGTAQEAANARILLQFYDGQGNYVRTNDSAEGWVDGEFVAINSTTPQTTINAVTSWVGVQKPVTNGTVRIAELDTVTNLERLLAVYEPGETNPSYRRTLIPGWCNTAAVPRCASVEVIASQRYIPAIKPRDYLCLTSISGIKWAAKSIYAGENNNDQQAAELMAKALQVMNAQLEKWSGGGTIQTPRFNANDACQIGPSNYI